MKHVAFLFPLYFMRGKRKRGGSPEAQDKAIKQMGDSDKKDTALFAVR